MQDRASWHQLQHFSLPCKTTPRGNYRSRRTPSHPELAVMSSLQDRHCPRESPSKPGIESEKKSNRECHFAKALYHWANFATLGHFVALLGRTLIQRGPLIAKFGFVGKYNDENPNETFYRRNFSVNRLKTIDATSVVGRDKRSTVGAFSRH